MENQLIKLQETADKLAVVEALYLYTAGIDTNDKGLLASAFTADAASDFGPAGKKAGFEYPVLEGRDIIASAISGSLNNIDTTHTVTNPLVTINGDSATMDVLVEAYHLPAKDHSRHYLMKNRYDVIAVKEKDTWLIKRITVDNVWRTGDPSVLAGI